jgi:subtilisin
VSDFQLWKGACVALLLAMLLYVPAAKAGDERVSWAQSADERSAITTKLIEKARSEGPQRLIVGLNTAFVPEGRLSRAGFATQRQGITAAQSSLMRSLGGFNAAEHRRFKYIPFMVVKADDRAIERLAKLSMVVSLEEDSAERPVMSSSNQVIGSKAAWDAGYNGNGWAVAVLDTGVDKTHPYFLTQSKVVSEACYSSTFQSQKSTTVCPDGQETSLASGSGVNCPLNVDGCDHGTHVAGSVAGNDQLGPNYGVARGASIIAIQVFSSFDNAGTCGAGGSPCALSFVSDQVAALERVYELRNSFNVAAVNMSLGGGNSSSEANCDSNYGSRKTAIDNLISVGIATVAASGNSGSKNSISTPGCISSSVSVGATTDADSVASFSNVADFLDLLAPGSSITSSVPGGGTSTWNGTSMATPHVAGAWAVLKQKSPSASVDTVLAALRDTGTPVDDGRSGGTVTDLRRINLDLALAEFGEPFPEFSSTPSAGSAFDFGDVVVGTGGAPLVLQVQNIGDAELTLACSIGGANAGSFGIGVCPGSLAPMESVELSLGCHPQAPGDQVAILELTTNDSDESLVSYSLLCNGTAPEFVSAPAAGANIDFGSVPVGARSDAQTIQVQNVGSAELTLACSLDGEDAASFDIDACPSSLAALANDSIAVICQPASSGSKVATLELNTNDADEGSMQFGLVCTATAPEFESSPPPGSTLDFANVQIGTQSDALTIQVENLGDAELTVDCTLAGDGASAFQVMQCPASVTAAALDQIEVSCQPNIADSYTASLDVATNDADESAVSYSLVCNGVPDTVFSDGFEGGFEL